MQFLYNHMSLCVNLIIVEIQWYRSLSSDAESRYENVCESDWVQSVLLPLYRSCIYGFYV